MAEIPDEMKPRRIEIGGSSVRRLEREPAGTPSGSDEVGEREAA